MNKLIHNSNYMNQIVANDVLDQAFAAVYQKRRKNSANNNIRSVSLQWQSLKKSLQIDLLAETYQLSPVAVLPLTKRATHTMLRNYPPTGSKHE